MSPLMILLVLIVFLILAGAAWPVVASIPIPPTNTFAPLIRALLYFLFVLVGVLIFLQITGIGHVFGRLC